MAEHLHFTATISEQSSGMRFDQAVAKVFCTYSRSCLQGWIKSGYLQLNGQTQKAKTKVYQGDLIKLSIQHKPHTNAIPEAITLNPIYEDAHLLVLNKPQGLVVHPGAGNLTGTLMNGLLHYSPSLNQIPRAGIVHRLDKDTTGLMVIAKTLETYTKLVQLIASRQVVREYKAITNGIIPTHGTIDEPIGRHPISRIRMAVKKNGKPAKTHFKKLRNYQSHSYLQLKLETGRTHQIRVHMAHIGFPLVGDPIYGKKVSTKSASTTLAATLSEFNRQALHAVCLKLTHPISGETMVWNAPLPEDFENLLDKLDENERVIT